MTEYGPPGSKYQTNFEKFKTGNGIREGSELKVKINGAEAVTGQLRDSKNRLVIVDQSHSKDEDNNAETINFKLKRRGRGWGIFRRKYNLPAGKYVLITWFWDNDVMKGGTYTDGFNIV